MMGLAMQLGDARPQSGRMRIGGADALIAADSRSKVRDRRVDQGNAARFQRLRVRRRRSNSSPPRPMAKIMALRGSGTFAS